MEVLPTAINAVVVAAVGLILWLGKGRIDKLEARIDRLEQRLDGRIDRFEGRIDGRIDRLEERMDARFDSVRSDLTRIALAVGVRPEAGGG
jgi:hypothetical protein